MRFDELTNRQKRMLLVGLLSLVGLAVVYFVGVQVSRIGKVRVDVKFAPYIATVELDGKKLKNGSAGNYVEAGEHELVVKLEGFDEVAQKYTVAGDKGMQYIVGQLTPNSENGKNVAAQYDRQYAEVEKIVGQETAKAGDEWRKENPILDELPITTLLYSIGYTYDLDGEIVIKVKTKSPIRRSAAVRRLLEITKDSPAKYRVDFDDYKNPFKESL